jgi:hypothetical protein
LSILARRWLINLALLALLLLLLLGIQLEQRQTQRESQLTSLDPNSVSRVVLRRTGEPAVRLERRPTGWEMNAPYAVPADGDAVSALLPVARARVARSLPLAGLDLAELGLERPAVRLELDGLELRFGTTEPVAALRYVQQGDTVQLIEDRYLPRLLSRTIDLVGRRLLPPDFSPGLGDLDGVPITAGTLAPLADATAVRVETAANPEDDARVGQVLNLTSADGGDGLVFAVRDGGTRWTRLDTGLSWLFATAPLPIFDSASAQVQVGERGGVRASHGSAVAPPNAGVMAMPPVDGAYAPAASQTVLDNTIPPSAAATATAPLPTERLAPPPPGTEPREQRPTDAIPNLRALVPSLPRDPNALQRLETDPFKPQVDIYRPPPDGMVPTPTIPQPAPASSDAEAEAEIPLRVETLRP